MRTAKRGEGAIVMASERKPSVGPRWTLAGDGGLLTAGGVALAGALALALDTVPHAPIAVGIGGGALVVAFAPLAAWRLHARRVDGSSTIGAVVGDMAGFLALFAVILLAGLFGQALAAVVSLLGGSLSWGEGAGVVSVAVAALFLAVAFRLDVDAVRDLARTRRDRVWLDVLRLAATAAYAAYVVCVVVLVTLKPGPPQDDANAGVGTALLLVVPVVFGALAVTGADLMVRHDERRPRGRLLTHV